jgi:hypothetical protein
MMRSKPASLYQEKCHLFTFILNSIRTHDDNDADDDNEWKRVIGEGIGGSVLSPELGNSLQQLSQRYKLTSNSPSFQQMLADASINSLKNEFRCISTFPWQSTLTDAHVHIKRKQHTDQLEKKVCFSLDLLTNSSICVRTAK